VTALAKLAIVCAIVGATTAAQADHVFLREADAAHAMFPDSTGSTRRTLEVSDSELESLGKILGRRIEAKSYPYLDVQGDHESVGAIFLLDVIGQSLPITFAVAVGKDGTVKDVRVMVYREPHGDEIEDRRFHKQFIGKALKDALTLGKDVDAITGATISSRSEAFAVKKSLALFALLHQHVSRAP
jgi:Na+-translocating ferredoxin:NAD+ oxidoreductase RnfG subunit